MNKSYSLSTSANFDFFLELGIWWIKFGTEITVCEVPFEGVFD